MIPALDISQTKIQLTKGKFAIVDRDDYEELSQHKWYFHSKGYAVRDTGGRKNRHSIMMHQEVMNSKWIDHINRNKLDNRKSNLRKATPSQNQANHPKRMNNTSGYIGVSETPQQRFHAYIENNYKRINIGYFRTAKEAAIARDIVAKKLHGDYASLNFKETHNVMA